MLRDDWWTFLKDSAQVYIWKKEKHKCHFFYLGVPNKPGVLANEKRWSVLTHVHLDEKRGWHRQGRRWRFFCDYRWCRQGTWVYRVNSSLIFFVNGNSFLYVRYVAMALGCAKQALLANEKRWSVWTIPFRCVLWSTGQTLSDEWMVQSTYDKVEIHTVHSSV